MILLGTVVETDELLQTVLYSIVAGVGITAVFSLSILGATRFVEFSRDERPGLAALAALLAGVSLLVCVAAVVTGLIVMTSK